MLNFRWVSSCTHISHGHPCWKGFHDDMNNCIFHGYDEQPPASPWTLPNTWAFRSCSLVTGLCLPGNRNVGNGDVLWRKLPMCIIYAQHIFRLSAFRSLVMMNKIGVYYIYILYIIYQILHAIHPKSSVLYIVHISHLSIHILTYL